MLSSKAEVAAHRRRSSALGLTGTKRSSISGTTAAMRRHSALASPAADNEALKQLGAIDPNHLQSLQVLGKLQSVQDTALAISSVNHDATTTETKPVMMPYSSEIYVFTGSLECTGISDYSLSRTSRGT